VGGVVNDNGAFVRDDDDVDVVTDVNAGVAVDDVNAGVAVDDAWMAFACRR
jgi:hypothetical protein